MPDAFNSPAGQTYTADAPAPVGIIGQTYDHYADLDRAGLIALLVAREGKIAELESGIANELEDIRLDVQEKDAKIARLDAATLLLQQFLSETQELCVELEEQLEGQLEAATRQCVGCMNLLDQAQITQRKLEHERDHALDIVERANKAQSQLADERDQLRVQVEQMQSAITKAAEEGLRP